MDAKSYQKWQKTLNKSCQFWQLNIPEFGGYRGPGSWGLPP